MRRVLCVAAVLSAVAPLAAQRGPSPAMSHLPADVLALACAPTVASAMPDRPLRVTGGQDSIVRRVYAPGDLVTINAGTRNGIEIGQQYYVRRVQTMNGRAVSDKAPGSVRTTGWLRVWAVDDTMSLATVEHVCDSIEIGDYLEPFALPVVPTPAADKPKAERDHYARVMAGTDLRHSFGKGDYFTIARGSNDGITPGAQFVVYRDKRARENFLFELGEAVAVDVQAATSTLQVTKSLDAMSDGDLVALRK